MAVSRGASDLTLGVFLVDSLSMQREQDVVAITLREASGEPASVSISGIHVEGAAAGTIKAVTLGRRYEVHLHEVE